MIYFFKLTLLSFQFLRLIQKSVSMKYPQQSPCTRGECRSLSTNQQQLLHWSLLYKLKESWGRMAFYSETLRIILQRVMFVLRLE